MGTPALTSHLWYKDVFLWDSMLLYEILKFLHGLWAFLRLSSCWGGRGRFEGWCSVLQRASDTRMEVLTSTEVREELGSRQGTLAFGHP